MEVAGNFCLKDTIFPGCLGDSELTKLAGRGTASPPTGRKLQSPLASQRLTSLLAPRRTHRSLLTNTRSPARLATRPGGTSSPQIPNSTSTSKTSCNFKQSPPPKNAGTSTTRRSIHLSQKSGKTNMTSRITMSPPNPKSHPTVRKTTSGALTRAAVALPVKGTTSSTLPASFFT